MSSLPNCSPGCGLASSGIGTLSFEGYSEALWMMAQACDLSSSGVGEWQVSGQPG